LSNDQTESANQQQMQFATWLRAQEVLAAQLAADPTLVLRMNEIEAFTQKRG
jgi:hypothetical protein